MHMTDALLSPAVGGALCAASVGALAYSTLKIRRDELCEKKVPVMAVAGAFVFAAQMINFTIPVTGSSGHIGGGILLSGLLGGPGALLTISAVLVIQSLFFADGGLLALGCNIFNMGVVPCLLVYPALFKPIVKKGINPKTLTVASIAAVVAGLQLGAFFVVLETLLSGITRLPFTAFLLLMQPIHLAIGLVEGVVTAAVLNFVFRMRPELLSSSVDGKKIAGTVSIRNIMLAMAACTVVVAGILSLFASANPDGLEWAMLKTAGTTELEASGIVHEQAARIQQSTAFLPDYTYASTDGEDPAMGTTIAGLVGISLTFVLSGATALAISAIKKKKKDRKADAGFTA